MIARNKPVNVYTTETAEWDIAQYRLSDERLATIGRALAAVPISESDIVEGTVRYRSFGEFVVLFHLGSTRSEFIVDICGIRPPRELGKSEAFLKALEKLSRIAIIRGATGV